MTSAGEKSGRATHEQDVKAPTTVELAEQAIAYLQSEEEQTLQAIVSLAYNVMNMPIGIWLPESHSELFRIRAATGLPHSYVTEASASIGDGSVLTTVVETGEPQIIHDLRTYISSLLSAQATTNRFAPQCLFARAHGDASSLREEGHTKRARCYDCSNAHDVVTIEIYAFELEATRQDVGEVLGQASVLIGESTALLKPLQPGG